MRLFKIFAMFLLIFLIQNPISFCGATNYRVTYGNIDARGFDSVSTYFSVSNLNNQTVGSIPSSCFKITDNGGDVTSTASVKCNTVDVIPPINLIFILDVSSSMDKDGSDPNSVRKWNWVIKACSTFIDGIIWVPGTQVAVIAFSGQARLLSPWDTNKKALMDSITNAYLGGATDYNVGFFNPIPDGRKSTVTYLWSLLSSEQQQNRKDVIFVTDGQPSPGRVTKLLTIQDSVGRFGQIYTVALQTPMNDDLRTMAANSNALAFECNTEQDLVNTFMLFAANAQKQNFCSLSWKAPYNCHKQDSIHNVSISFQYDSGEEPIITNRSYVPPKNTIAQLNSTQKALDFSKASIGTMETIAYNFQLSESMKTVSQITIKQKKTDYKFNHISVTRTGVFSDSIFSIPFTGISNDLVSVWIEYTPPIDSLNNDAILVVNSEICASEVPMIGRKTTLGVENDNNITGTLSIKSLSPNPASSNLNVSFRNSNSNSRYILNVYDILGNKVIEKTLNLPFGESNQEFEVSGLSIGKYYILINTNNATISKEFTVIGK